MNMTGLYQVVVLALATAAISVTISKARIFTSARECITSLSNWLGELVSCSYCTSHWVAIALVAIYRPVLISQWIIIDLLISMFGVVAIATIVSGMIIRLNPLPSRNEEIESEIVHLRETLQVARIKLVEQARIIKELQK